MLWAARKLRRPVKWTCERSEAMLADEHARDNVSEAELALDKDDKFLGLRAQDAGQCRRLCRLRPQPAGALRHVGTLVGVYVIPAAYVDVAGVMANTNGTAPYRGAGRPEATYVIERLIDDAARELGLDRVELRRKNMIPESALPYQTPLGPYLRLRRFREEQDKALKLADVAGFAARKAESQEARQAARHRHRQRDREGGRPGPAEFAEIRFNPSGNATLLMGSKNQGQGHETMFKQILNEKLGIDPDDVQYIDGDTDRVAFGMGTNGSRSTVIGGSALWMAADKVIAKGKRSPPTCSRRPSRTSSSPTAASRSPAPTAVSLKDVAKAAFHPATWPQASKAGSTRPAPSRPRRTPIPMAAMSARSRSIPTPARRVDRYVVVDDVGTVINPIGLKGQIHGGVAQGWARSCGAGRLRPRVRPAPDRQLHGLRHAARRDDPEHGSQEQPGADQAQPAGRQGRGRGRHGRRPAGGHERRHGRAGAARRHATC